jgi:hypothetical protein
MVETAAHLFDQVIPRVPVRQWVLSFPFPLRIVFAAHPELLTPVLRIVHRVIARLMKLLTRKGYLVEEQGMTYLADIGRIIRSSPCKRLRGLAGRAGPGWPDPSPGTNSPPDCLCPGSAYRIAFGPRAGHKVLSLRTVARWDENTTTTLCADAHGVSLDAAVRCGAHQRKELKLEDVLVGGGM